MQAIECFEKAAKEYPHIENLSPQCARSRDLEFKISRLKLQDFFLLFLQDYSRPAFTDDSNWLQSIETPYKQGKVKF